MPSGNPQSRINLPALEWAAITPSDTAKISPVPRSLYVTVSGNLVMKGADDVSGTFPVTVGQTLACSPNKIMATGTTATVIALW